LFLKNRNWPRSGPTALTKVEINEAWEQNHGGVFKISEDQCDKWIRPDSGRNRLLGDMPRNLEGETPPATPAPTEEGKKSGENTDMLWFSLDFWGFDSAAITFDDKSEVFYFKVPVILTKKTGTFFFLLDVVLEGNGFYKDDR
jgi:hypothetical protein